MSFWRASHVVHVARQASSGAEQVNLEDQHPLAGRRVQDVLQRRVGDQAAVQYWSVPIRTMGKLAQRAAGHDVLG